MQNSIQPGETLDFIAPNIAGTGKIASGQPHLDNDVFYVAATEAAEGESVAGVTVGVFELTKKSADNISTMTKVYWDSTNREITTTASGNKPVGHSTEEAGSSSTTVKVKLVPTL
jgi:predicted RecA/RadA family phage recombinase